MTTTVLAGVICSNTCIGIQIGDNTLDIYGLFTTPGAEATGPVTVTIDALDNVLATDGHPLPAGVTADVSFTAPALSSFPAGAFELTAVGPPNIWGYMPKEVEEICPAIPGVPEPSTCLLLAIGLVICAALFPKKARKHASAAVNV
jgi:hypothetical protein